MKGGASMEYEKLLEDLRNAPKDKMLESVQELFQKINQEQQEKLKELNLDDCTNKEIVLMLQNRKWFENLLINILK